jgi:hypothetical protein
METECSLPCSQQPTTGPCLEQDASSPQISNPFPEINSNVILASTLRSSELPLPFRLSGPVVYAFVIPSKQQEFNLKSSGQLAKNFRLLYGTRCSITIFVAAHHWILSYTTEIDITSRTAFVFKTITYYTLQVVLSFEVWQIIFIWSSFPLCVLQLSPTSSSLI